MPRSRSSYRVIAGITVALAGIMAASTAAWAADGPPTVEALTPQSGPTAGGIPVRIYGTGLQGATSVKFGGRPSPKFAVIDTRLITAIVPPAAGGAAADNTFVDVTVTDDQGSNTLTSGFFYTNATITVTPNTGLHPGDAITVKVTGYAPNTPVIIPEVNPLQVYVEGGPPFPPGPPPYADPLAILPTDANGSLTVHTNLSNPFNQDGQSFDPNAVCPPNKLTANYLGTSKPLSQSRPTYSARCIIAVTQFGMGTIDTPISFTNDPVPAPPVLRIDHSSASQGDTIRIRPGSVRWNANPLFGSSTTANKPGQTKVVLQICGIHGNADSCSSATGKATVTPSRYIDQAFRGARLWGSIVVGSDVPSSCTCVVRARQYRPGGGFIQATAAVNIT